MGRLVNVWMEAADPSWLWVQEKKVHPLAEKPATQTFNTTKQMLGGQMHRFLQLPLHKHSFYSEEHLTYRRPPLKQHTECGEQKCVSCLQKLRQTSGLVYFSAQQPSMSFLIMFLCARPRRLTQTPV